MATEPATYPRAIEADERPAEPVDYAALNAVYGVLLTTLVITTRERAREDPISGRELVPIAAATFALSKVIAREKIGSWVREPFVDDPVGERRPRGHSLQRAVGELVTCTRCVGAWSALGIVGLRLASPDSGRIVTNVLAASAGNDWLQSGFKLLCARVNRTEQQT
ncbi:MAG: hypothetical protein QOH76_149 [Thermoleophilaceae bacterium]|jgi:hypothetical protein|nr:hypothetical protein [Thermoleophilaceae bacterium]